MLEPVNRLPEWAPRLKQRLVRVLYENEAQGIYDDELLDEVGWALVARCQSFIAAVEAVQGRARCPVCEKAILHHAMPDEILRCPACGWQTSWQEYFHTIQHKQLSGAEEVMGLFQDFIDHFPRASRPQDKMLWIDILIHGWHWNAHFNRETRAAGVNLIEGNYHQVIEFLDSLSAGTASTQGVVAQKEQWRQKLERTAELWNDARLRGRLHQSDDPDTPGMSAVVG
jgi:hypothetical protein